MGGLDVIMTSDFHLAPPIQNSWIFKPITNTLNSIAINYCSKYTYKLFQNL